MTQVIALISDEGTEILQAALDRITTDRHPQRQRQHRRMTGSADDTDVDVSQLLADVGAFADEIAKPLFIYRMAWAQYNQFTSEAARGPLAPRRAQLLRSARTRLLQASHELVTVARSLERKRADHA